MAKMGNAGGRFAGKAIVALILVAVLVVGNLALYQNADLITMFLCGAGYTENSKEASE